MTDKLPDAVMERAESYLDAQSKEAYRCCETCGHRFFNSRDYPKRAYLTAARTEALPLVYALEAVQVWLSSDMARGEILVRCEKALAHFRGGAEETERCPGCDSPSKNITPYAGCNHDFHHKDGTEERPNA